MVDEDVWVQEYELKWFDVVSVWFDYDLIFFCEDVCVGLLVVYCGGMCFVGVDIVVCNDFFVIWVVEFVDGQFVM